MKVDVHSYRITVKLTRTTTDIDDLVVLSRDIRNVRISELASVVSLLVSQWCGEFLNAICIERISIDNIDDEE